MSVNPYITDYPNYPTALGYPYYQPPIYFYPPTISTKTFVNINTDKLEKEVAELRKEIKELKRLIKNGQA